MGGLSKRFLERLRDGRPLVLDAAMGTELQRRDADTRLPLWSAGPLLRDPELVEAIHGDEAAAGADVLTANTFRTHARSVRAGGSGADAAALTARAVGLAHRAAAMPRREIFVAGSLSPLEDCYRPDLAPDDATLETEHAAQARELAAAGADLILAETHNSIREAAAALLAAKATGLPVAVSLVTDGKGRLLSGETIEDAAARLVPLGPDAIGINCVPAARVLFELDRLKGAAGSTPLLAYGNLGLPQDEKGWEFSEELAPEAYAEEAARWLALGARIVGGCCGTTPDHTRAVRALIDGMNEDASKSQGSAPRPSAFFRSSSS
ncbi:MAG TPA: homocysteine S-methyltransferase family protein [Thermoanaerobaculia bacterium]|jgi:S-methylmethionine-dependent homocysteine/selenocysteine methylase|nr:homocysteine S-methyltransferase family protein [Thermoanaerobaculia bacterium]